MADLIGKEVVGLPTTSQVYKATHDELGARLPYMERSFISFSYGGKYIEDFGFIATIPGDRLERDVYASFQDNISESNVLEGQFYWSTHYDANTLDLTLSTDGITEKQYDEFKRYFIPGKARELILSEHPNRGIYARIASVPQGNLLPFEQEIITKMGGRDYETKTSLYRGDVIISFIMDDPHWHAIQDILYFEDAEGYKDFDAWKDANNNSTQIYKTQDALKIVEEDGIPTVAMMQPDIMFGTNLIADYNPDPSWEIGTAKIEYGVVGVLLHTFTGFSIMSGPENAKYFYYPGTANCMPKLTFTLTPEISVTGVNNGYISTPRNSFLTNAATYNYIRIESQQVKEFRFTTPTVFTAYNQAIKIFKEMNGDSVVEVRQAIRDGVNHWAARAYAISIIPNSGTIIATNLINAMKNFITEDNALTSVTFTFDSKTGEATGTFRYYDTMQRKFINAQEQVGDMIRSDYLIIEDRNFPEDGYVMKWESEHRDRGHRIYHNISNGLNSVLLEYQPMYL